MNAYNIKYYVVASSDKKDVIKYINDNGIITEDVVDVNGKYMRNIITANNEVIMPNKFTNKLRNDVMARRQNRLIKINASKRIIGDNLINRTNKKAKTNFDISKVKKYAELTDLSPKDYINGNV